MSSISPHVEPIMRALAPRVHAMILEEVERLALASQRPEPKRDRAEREIAEACRQVAAATDSLVQAQYAGLPEIPARRALERACRRLSAAMHRHGRMPEGA